MASDMYLRQKNKLIAHIGPIMEECQLPGCRRPIADIFGPRCVKKYNEKIFLCREHIEHFGDFSCKFIVDNRKTSGNLIIKRGPNNPRVHAANSSKSQNKLYLTTIKCEYRDKVPISTSAPELVDVMHRLNETIKKQSESSQGLIVSALDRLTSTISKVGDQLNENVSQLNKKFYIHFQQTDARLNTLEGLDVGIETFTGLTDEDDVEPPEVDNVEEEDFSG